MPCLPIMRTALVPIFAVHMFIIHAFTVDQYSLSRTSRCWLTECALRLSSARLLWRAFAPWNPQACEHKAPEIADQSVYQMLACVCPRCIPKDTQSKTRTLFSARKKN
ncbi:hypothetical protein K437DRAFT_7238 [Tilletiaria anomala UBC 951]|uniref:Uncharacterized protein n=1 Tax=Tilletiaria anomala (strain ATCC 24038 / CBS 436.72 / UBC 951) TaxID=1037660 RepID=A0A066WIV8_TILAU|nr:uncharacterized protein K437DRAFT_7238 [Tilletiaria anomala UBC 951]KDN52483.1 hypothetical protein K437DRAFT_7238 [Tilletiaria anomala UBC 951]